MSAEHGPQFDPLALGNIQRNSSEMKRINELGYNFHLDELDALSSEIGHRLLEEQGIAHAAPSGFLSFPTAEARIEAIELLEGANEVFVGRWRTGQIPSSLPSEEKRTYAKTLPVKEEYQLQIEDTPKS